MKKIEIITDGRKIKLIADGRKIKPWKGKEPVWIRWDTILQAYKQPSIEKLKFWKRIEENERNLEATVGINTKNSSFFTVHGFMLDEEWRSIEFKITKSNCYVRYRY